MGRFVKGQSGNPNGRTRKRRPNVSAFDIVVDKRLSVTQNGEERELTVDEAPQLQTYQAALGGSRLAVRAVLKMIEKREQALRRLAPPPAPRPATVYMSYNSDSANGAMLLLGILCRTPKWLNSGGPRDLVVNTWAAQAAISRPGRRKREGRDRDDLHLFVLDYAKIRHPRGSK